MTYRLPPPPWPTSCPAAAQGGHCARGAVAGGGDPTAAAPAHPAAAEEGGAGRLHAGGWVQEARRERWLGGDESLPGRAPSAADRMVRLLLSRTISATAHHLTHRGPLLIPLCQVNLKGTLLPLPRNTHGRPTVNDILKDYEAAVAKEVPEGEQQDPQVGGAAGGIRRGGECTGWQGCSHNGNDASKFSMLFSQKPQMAHLSSLPALPTPPHVHPESRGGA